MSDQAVVPPTLPDAAKPKRRWRWLKILIGASAAGLLGIVVLGSYNSVSLKVQMDRNGSLVVTNTDSKPVEIQSVTINDRKDCAVYRTGFQTLTDFKPMTLQVGDQVFMTSLCNIVRVTFETDRGSSTFTFSR